MESYLYTFLHFIRSVFTAMPSAIYALAALLLVFLFIKIVLLIIKCISDLVLFWKK